MTLKLPSGSLKRALSATLLLLSSLSATGASLQQQLQSLNFDLPRQRLPAPAFSLPTLDGGTVRLADFRGRPVVLHFWATFCTSCREEMPALAAMAKRLEDRGPVVLAVSVDRGSRRQVERFLDDLGIQLSVPLDADGAVRRAYEIDALPTTYLIGRDGRFLGRGIGPRDWNDPASDALLEQLDGS